MSSEELLNKFYLTYWIWLCAGAPEVNEHEFSREFGLCTNLKRMAFGSESTLIQREDASKLMRSQFQNSGLHWEYPFGGVKEYLLETDCECCHLNQDRIEWVRGKVVEMLEESNV